MLSDQILLSVLWSESSYSYYIYFSRAKTLYYFKIKHSNIHIHDRCVHNLLEADRAQPTEYRWSWASDWGEALGLALNQARAVLLAKQFRKPVSKLISGQIGIVFKSYCQYQYRHLGIYYYRSCLLRAIQ